MVVHTWGRCMPTLTQLTIDADGAIDANISDSDADLTFFDDCNDAPDGVSADFIELDAGLMDGNYDAWFSLTNVNSDLIGVNSLNIDIDVEVVGSVANDTVDLTCRIFDADNDTTGPLTDESATLGDQTDTTRVQRNVVFGNVTGNKAQWDTAHIRFRFIYDRVAGADSYNIRIYGCDVDGTYSVRSPSDRDKGAVQRADSNSNRLDKGAVEKNVVATAAGGQARLIFLTGEIE